MGGLAAWERIESIRLSGQIEHDGESIDICIIKKRPNQIRTTVTIPLPGDPDQHVQVIRAFDGKTAWTATRLAGAPEFEREILDEQAAADLHIDAGVLPLLIKLWRRNEAILRLADTVASETEPLYVIEATLPKSNRSLRFYLSSNSYHVVEKTSATQNGPTSSQMSDFATIEGIVIPRNHRIENETTGVSFLHTDSIEVGVGIYDDYFEAASKMTVSAN